MLHYILQLTVRTYFYTEYFCFEAFVALNKTLVQWTSLYRHTTILNVIAMKCMLPNTFVQMWIIVYLALFIKLYIIVSVSIASIKNFTKTLYVLFNAYGIVWFAPYSYYCGNSGQIQLFKKGGASQGSSRKREC